MMLVNEAKYCIEKVNSGFFSNRINLSPFTKDFRGKEQLNEYYTIFVTLPKWQGI